MRALKLTQVGDSVGLILPEEILAHLKLGKGDTVYLAELPDGLRLTTHDSDLNEQLALGREFMREFHETFRELAK
jgi:putative addiction module antidote